LCQEIYEYWHGGDPNRNRINLLRSFDQKEMKGGSASRCSARCRMARCSEFA
jgi:hypothetical protein